ncbi:hypothetical protein NHX12_029461 [Muraenolepis orangiensis]|uniref:Uncharacterized protein n=1 Tax=Muraenolepis orangiensis TaxID=630683 RepID=A0A9Q0IL92_9TELE|nr:hypothetical protein NHX12_029461 [Muraenolepis orangiensis]
MTAYYITRVQSHPGSQLEPSGRSRDTVDRQTGDTTPRWGYNSDTIPSSRRAICCQGLVILAGPETNDSPSLIIIPLHGPSCSLLLVVVWTQLHVCHENIPGR